MIKLNHSKKRILETHLSDLVFVKNLHLDLVLGASVDEQLMFPHWLQRLLAHLHYIM